MSEEMGLNIKLAMESQSFQTQISTINRQMKLVQSEFQNASSKLSDFGSSTDKLKSKSASLTQQIELGRSKTTLYTEAQTKSRETLEKNVTANQLLKQKLDETTKSYASSVTATGKNSTESKKLEEELKQLKQEYTNSNNVISNNARTLDNNTIKVNDNQRSVNQLESQLRTTNREIATQTSNWTKFGDSMKKVGSDVSAAGDKFKTVGQGIAKVGATITTTFAVIGAGSIKSYEEVKTGTNEIARLTGATGQKFEDLKQVYKDTARESANSFEDIGTAVGTVSVRLNLTGDALKTASLDFMKFAKVNKTDVTTSVSLVSRAMGDAGIKSTEYKEVLDLLTMASQKSGIQVSVLSENLAKYGAPMRALGFDTRETIALFSGWEKAGVNTELAFGGMKKAIANWGKAGKDSSVEFKKVLKDISDTPTLAEATTKAIEIFGQKAGPDLADAIKGGRFAYEDFLKILEGSDGTLDATAKNMGSYTAEMKKAWHSVTLASAELGEAIAKELAPIMKSVSGTIKDLTTRWDGLNESTKSSIARFGLITIAIGGIATALGAVFIGIGAFLSGIGGIITMGGTAIGTIGGIAGGIGAVGVATTGVATAGAVATPAIASLGVAFGTALMPLLPFIAGVGALAVAGVAIKNVLDKEVIPEVDLFANKVTTTNGSIIDSNSKMGTSVDTTVIKISDATKKSVGAYMELDTKATASLTNLYVNSTIITTKNSKDVVAQYIGMSTLVKTELDKRYNEEHTTMKTFFDKSGALSKTEEDKALAKLKQDNVNKKAEEDKYVKEIQAIVKGASDKKRALTLEEQQKINDIQDKMKTNGIKTLSDSELESKVILERIKDYGTRITAEQASEVIKNANKQRDGSIKSANETYDKTTASIIKMRDESHSITADQATKLIADAKKQKDGTIAHAEELRSGAVAKITSMNKDIGSSVNTSTGDILTKWDSLKRWWDGWIPGVKTFFSQMQTIPSTGKMNGNWTGNNNYEGGFTTLHEKGYEVYDLPKATKIYNHDASEAMVLQTAKQVAQSVLASSSGKGGITQNVKIYSPTALSPSETARQNKRALQELALNF